MADYESLAHLPRWRRVLIWFCENEVGRTILGFTAAIVIGGPAFIFGKWWFGVLAVFLLGFFAGYSLARSFWKSDDYIPKL